MGSDGEQFDNGDAYTPARMNRKTNTIDTGAGCTADTKTAGKIFMPTSSDGSFVQNQPAFILPSDGTTVKTFATTDATQTLTNKTINATNNTLTDTSIAQGDLLVANATPKFVRKARGAAAGALLKSTATDIEWLAKGTAHQHLRVNDGATDIEWASGLEEIASGAGIGNAGIAISSIPARKHLIVVINLDGNGNTGAFSLRFNDDSGTNYATRSSTSGAAESTATSAAEAILGAGIGNEQATVVIHIMNLAAFRKVGFYSVVTGAQTSAATAPIRIEGAIKWDNAVAQITRIDIIRATGTLNGNTTVRVYGSD